MNAAPERALPAGDSDYWLDANNRYLACSLHWLRLRLQYMTQPAAKASTTTSRRSRFGRRSSPNLSPVIAANAAPDAEEVRQAEAERETAARVDPPPALLMLAQRLGLSEFERDTLLLCAATELDPFLPSLLAAAQGNAALGYPSFGLALQLFEMPSWDALSPHRPLRHLRLLEINQPGSTPLTASALRADERIVNYLKGLNALDERLAALLTPEDNVPPLSDSQRSAAEAALHQLRVTAVESHPPQVALTGADVGSKLAVAGQVCAALGRRLYRLSLDALPAHKAEIETLARLWQRESLLLPVTLYLDAENLDGAAPEAVSAFHWFMARDTGMVFAGLREPAARLGGYSIEVAKPTPVEQHDAWQACLEAADTESSQAAGAARALAGQFDLNLGDIRHAATLISGPSSSKQQQPLRAWDACRKLTQPRLDLLAQRIEPKARWNDLVLTGEAVDLLRQIVGQVRHRYRVYEDWGYARKLSRGLGINALFAGESGTGKTMAAEVLANALRLALYRIDLSAVVSKYIGETEKNLRRLFDAAEAGGAILLFDEADALFGKRSEVKDSHDRYANIEINYLLQRMEAFSGLAILATNMKSALDNAFMRRLRFVVNFQFPGPAERKLLWQKALPSDVPREALDYERLARFNLSGGNVTSIALNAAFAAAQGGTPVNMQLLLSAVRRELRKLDRPINEAEFR